ncbi:unnamed protein product [Calypogeia fissa]
MEKESRREESKKGNVFPITAYMTAESIEVEFQSTTAGSPPATPATKNKRKSVGGAPNGDGTSYSGHEEMFQKMFRKMVAKVLDGGPDYDETWVKAMVEVKVPKCTPPI